VVKIATFAKPETDLYNGVLAEFSLLSSPYGSSNNTLNSQ